MLCLAFLTSLPRARGPAVFVSPIDGSISPISPRTPATSISVQLSGLSAPYIALVAKTCSGFINTISLTPANNYTASTNNSQNYYGNCTFTATITGNPTISPPTPVSVLVGNTVQLSTPNSTITVNAGSTFPIELAYSPTTSPNTIFAVDLNCNIAGVASSVQQITGGSSQQSQNFSVPSYFYGTSCVLKVLNTVPSYYRNTTQIITVQQQVVIAAPLSSANLIIGVPFNTSVTTSNSTVNSAIVLTFVSSTSIENVVNSQTNLIEAVNLNSDFFGVTTLSVATTTPYAAPAQITLNFKYGLEFTTVTNPIVPGASFQIFLTTSATPVGDVPTVVDVFLTCGDVQISSWTDVPLNEMSTLSAIPADTVTQCSCTLSTSSSSIYYYQTNKLVSIIAPSTTTTITNTMTNTETLTSSIPFF